MLRKFWCEYINHINKIINYKLMDPKQPSDAELMKIAQDALQALK